MCQDRYKFEDKKISMDNCDIVYNTYYIQQHVAIANISSELLLKIKLPKSGASKNFIIVKLQYVQ